MQKSTSICLFGALVAIFFSYTLTLPLSRFTTVAGLFRTPRQFPANRSVISIADTVHCEDLHYHGPSHTLFTACGDVVDQRFAWFPPLAQLRHDKLQDMETGGSLRVIDPETKQATRLRMVHFPHAAFHTHGIDVLSDPTRPTKAVYILAVNHLPHPASLAGNASAPKARSQVEIFHHVLGSGLARHVRSVRHELIRTPNDVVAVSPDEFYVTNDHFYRSGWRRVVEDVWWGATWTGVVRVQVNDMKADGEEGVEASMALENLHNSNGLGKGWDRDTVLVSQAASGVMHVGQRDDKGGLSVRDTVLFDSTVDNPTYFRDPWGKTLARPGGDKSGIVMAGLTNGAYLYRTMADVNATEPVMVWFVQEKKKQGNETGGWEKKLLFEDDGTRIRSAATAVLVGIDPNKENGERRAWLFVTGFLSTSVVAVKVDL